MKGNTAKVDMVGFAACWQRHGIVGRQKPLQLPSSRKKGGTGVNSPEYKNSARFMRKFGKTGGVPRGKAYAKMFRLGYRSESRKDFTREPR